MADEIFITVGVDIDDATLEAEAAKAGSTAGKSFGSKFSDSSRKGAQGADAIFKDLTASLKRINSLQQNLGRAGVNTNQFAPLARGLERILALQRQFDADRARLSKDTGFLNLLKQEEQAIRTLTSSQTRELQSTVAAANIQERAKAHAADRAAALTNIQAQRDAQLQVNAARTAGKARIVLAQQIGAQLLSAERIISNGITNIIRGTSKAVSSVWQSTVGSLRRTFSERRTIVEGGLRNESRLFTQSTIISQKANQGIVGAISNNLGAIGGGLALGAGLRQIFTLGSDFTRGLNVLQAQLQLTGDQMKEVDALSIKLGNDISLPGVSALDAANAIGLLSKQFAGLGPAAIGAAEAAAQGTLQLARAVGAAPEEAAATVGAAVNVFGEQASNAVHVADQLTAALSQAAGTSFSDFSLAFSQGASVVSSFIKPADGATNAITEFASAIALLARGGLVGQTAGDSLKQFFLQANRGGKEVDAALAGVSKRAGETGTAFFTADHRSRGLVETIDILQRGLAGLSDEERANTLQTIFGADASRAANILIGQGAAELLKAEAATQRQGAAAALAAAQNKGLAGAVDAIKSQFETFAIQIFKKVNPILGDLGLKVAAFIDKIANGAGAFATFRKALLGVGAALGAIVALRGFTEIVGIISSIVTLLGPFGIAIAAVGAVVGIATGGFRNFGDTFTRLGEIAKTASKVIVAALRTVTDFLSRTFSPVIADIRRQLDPAISAIGTAAARLKDIFLSAKNSFDAGGFKSAITSLKTNLGRLGKDIGDALQPIGRAIVDKLIVVRDFAVQIRDRLVAAVRSIDFGAVASAVGRGISTVTSSAVGSSLAGAGIGAVAGGVIAGPLGVALGAAFGAAVGLAVPKIKEAISRIDVASLFGKFLDGVRKVGETIGKLISSKQFLVGLAGIAAAAAAIAVQFISGFVSGILGHLDQVAAAGAAILNALFAQNSIVKAVLALAILLRKQIFGIFTSNKVGEEGGKAIAKNVADGAAKELPVTLGARLKTLGTSTIGAFKDLGSKAAQGLSIALSAGLSGSALGGASSNLEKGLGIAGLAGSIAAGAAAAGPAGAIAAGGIGLLTTAIAANAKVAAEAKGLMLQYKDAILQTGDAGAGTAEVLGANLSGASNQVKKDLKDAGFTVTAFNKAIQEGRTKEFLDDLNKSLEKNFHALDSRSNLNRNQNVFTFLDSQVKAVGKSLKDINLDEALNPKGFSGTAFSGLSTLVGNLTDIGTKAKDARDAELEVAKSVQAEKLQGELDALANKASELGAKADAANKKLLDLLAPKQQATTPQQAQDTATLDTPAFAADVAAGFEKGVASAAGGAAVRQGLQDFGLNVVAPLFATAVKEGIKTGDPGAALAVALQGETIAINQLEVPQPAKDALLAQLNEQFAQATAAIPVGVEANAADAAAAGAQAQAEAKAAFIASGVIPVATVADLIAAAQAGARAGDTASSAAQTAVDANPLTVSINTESANAAADSFEQRLSDATKNSSSATSAANTTGAAVSAGLAAGITSGGADVNTAASAVADGAVTTAKAKLGVSSPSTVFQTMGINVGQGLVAGLRSQTGAVNAAASQMVSGAAQAASRSLTAFNAIGRNIVLSVAAGIRSASTVVVKSVTATAGTLVQTMQLALKIGSPSKVFMGIGEDIVKGLAIGITDTTDAAVTAAEDVAKAVVEATKTQASRLAAASSASSVGVFDLVFDSAAQEAKSAGLAANRAIVTALEDITDSVASEAVKLWQAAAKAVNERTPEEQRIIARSDFASAFNFSNQEAITKAVDAIKDIGKNLIEQGVSAQGAADSMLAYRNSLLAAAAAAGLNVTQVGAIVDALGLSNAGLAEFVRLSNQATAIVGASPGFIPTAPPPLTPGPNAAQTFIINNEFATPFDDPQAVSLAVVNRLAQSVKR